MRRLGQRSIGIGPSYVLCGNGTPPSRTADEYLNNVMKGSIA